MTRAVTPLVQLGREQLVEILTTTGGNVSRAAVVAGVERQSLHRLLKRYGLRAQDYRPGWGRSAIARVVRQRFEQLRDA
jgi:DNA-binding NtrC family response regulator